MASSVTAEAKAQGWHIFTTQYTSTCPGCGGEICPGRVAAYSDDKGTFHIQCTINVPAEGGLLPERRPLRIILGRQIGIPLADLDDRLKRSLQRVNEFENPDRETAKREMVEGWEELPTHIKLWDERGSFLVLPRGFFSRLCTGLTSAGYDWTLDDSRIEVPRTWAEESSMKQVCLDDRRGQFAAADVLIRHENGILQAPPGMGKTATMLEVIRRSKQRSLILVERTNIAQQWIDRAEQFLGIELGILGDDGWDERDVTVALRQTLWTRAEELYADGFFERWGLVCADECHHVGAYTMEKLVKLFPARYRFGLSATPDRHNGSFPIVTATIGDVVCKIDKAELVSTGVLVRPHLTRIDTTFQFDFRKTEPKRDEDGEVLRNWRGKPRVERNNYHALVEALIVDSRRNAQIAEQIAERKNKQLVVSRRLIHLDLIEAAVKALGYDGDIHRLTGEQTTAERMDAIDRIRTGGPCVVLSTIADEALDVPSLEVLHLCFPTASTPMVVQQVGRIERASPGKTEAEVVDYVDVLTPILKNQFKRKRSPLYRREGYDAK